MAQVVQIRGGGGGGLRAELAVLTHFFATCDLVLSVLLLQIEAGSKFETLLASTFGLKPFSRTDTNYMGWDGMGMGFTVGMVSPPL